MSSSSLQITRKIVSGRELFICDNFADAAEVARIAQLCKGLPYQRSEKSRPDTIVSGEAAEISEALQESEKFFARMKAFGEEMFPEERFTTQRLYVNKGVYGDVYFPHRDCNADLANITVLYYANPVWHGDWAGETLFYDDDHNAEIAVTPRPGRALVSRGAIIHRGGVPSRICTEPRYTIAYKLSVSWF